MFDVLIREAGARFGLGDKALPLVQMLLAYMTAKESGGLAGFLEKFKAAGFGPIIQSWLGGGPSAQPIGNNQIETVLGSSGGLLSLVTGKLELGRDNVTSALGYLLPAIVGKLTPGGSIPSGLPAQVTSLAAAGQSLLAAPPPSSAVAPAAGGGLMKWLPWAIVALAALFGVSYWGKNRTGDAPAPVEAPVDAPAPAASGAPLAPEALPAPAPSATGSEAGAAASGDEPTGAAVVGLQVGDMPALKVYFDSGKTDVHGDFAAKSKELVDYMAAHADAKAVISGFNDPTGDAAANEELSKNRAKAVQAALVGAGVAEDRTVLEKPADATGSAASNAASRRVEVVLRK
ncbi:YidB family protein [Ottowia sp.]|uniref:YidB family protein n=1 Tax=Ottowia sp. TaxID=1898956 RepID=UPI0025D6CC57|nr:YidB family protein [Ottowia sp.]MBK6614283.1 OmpA family protein [Ottowia sp.]